MTRVAASLEIDQPHAHAHAPIELFKIHVQQAERTKLNEGGGSIGKENTVSLIPLDLPRTFPALAFFQPSGPWHDHLRQVLEAYACYRPDIGYVQGMSYIAASLLINVVCCALGAQLECA
jgi:TBC1 domain family member 14